MIFTVLLAQRFKLSHLFFIGCLVLCNCLESPFGQEVRESNKDHIADVHGDHQSKCRKEEIFDLLLDLFAVIIHSSELLQPGRATKQHELAADLDDSLRPSLEPLIVIGQVDNHQQSGQLVRDHLHARVVEQEHRDGNE